MSGPLLLCVILGLLLMMVIIFLSEWENTLRIHLRLLCLRLRIHLLHYELPRPTEKFRIIQHHVYFRILSTANRYLGGLCTVYRFNVRLYKVGDSLGQSSAQFSSAGLLSVQHNFSTRFWIQTIKSGQWLIQAFYSIPHLF